MQIRFPHDWQNDASPAKLEISPSALVFCRKNEYNFTKHKRGKME